MKLRLGDRPLSPLAEGKQLARGGGAGRAASSGGLHCSQIYIPVYCSLHSQLTIVSRF